MSQDNDLAAGKAAKSAGRKTTNSGAFKKGEKRPGQGRPKGSINKNNQALREMILQALNEQDGGGVAYLKLQAIENPGPFMSLLGKVLPTTLAGDPDAPMQMVARIELVPMAK